MLTKLVYQLYCVENAARKAAKAAEKAADAAQLSAGGVVSIEGTIADLIGMIAADKADPSDITNATTVVRAHRNDTKAAHDAAEATLDAANQAKCLSTGAYLDCLDAAFAANEALPLEIKTPDEGLIEALPGYHKYLIYMEENTLHIFKETAIHIEIGGVIAVYFEDGKTVFDAGETVIRVG